MRLASTLLIALATWTGGICTALALNTDIQHGAYLRILVDSAEVRFSSWAKLITSTLFESNKVKLTRVNTFFNQRIRFAEDMETSGESDYWATPMETLAAGAGDCEDFAIAKYYTLLKMSVPEKQLRLAYARAHLGGAASSLFKSHMVLAYYDRPEAEPLILDNLIDSVEPSSRRPDLQLIFSFNGEGIYHGSATAATQRLSRWQDLMRRAHDEGF